MRRTRLNGNGLQETGFLDRDYASVYTKPDETDNRSAFVNLTGRHSPRDRVTLSGSGVLPSHRNGHAQRRPQRGLARSGGVPAGRERPEHAVSVQAMSGRHLRRDEPEETCNGLTEPHRHPSAQCGRVRAGHLVARGGPARTSSDGRRRVRRQRGALPSVLRARVSQSGSQRHWRRSLHRCARRSRWAHTHDESLCHRHAPVARALASHVSRDVSIGRSSRTLDASPLAARAGIARRHAHLQPGESGCGSDDRSATARQCVRRLQRRQPRGDVDRAWLCRSRVTVQAAECDGRRSAARSGHHAHD